MKFVLLSLALSLSANADFVFMREAPEGKSIQLQSGCDNSTLSDRTNGNWALYPDISVWVCPSTDCCSIFT